MGWTQPSKSSRPVRTPSLSPPPDGARRIELTLHRQPSHTSAVVGSPGDMKPFAADAARWARDLSAALDVPVEQLRVVEVGGGGRVCVIDVMLGARWRTPELVVTSLVRMLDHPSSPLFAASRITSGLDPIAGVLSRTADGAHIERLAAGVDSGSLLGVRTSPRLANGAGVDGTREHAHATASGGHWLPIIIVLLLLVLAGGALLSRHKADEYTAVGASDGPSLKPVTFVLDGHVSAPDGAMMQTIDVASLTSVPALRKSLLRASARLPGCAGRTVVEICFVDADGRRLRFTGRSQLAALRSARELHITLGREQSATANGRAYSYEEGEEVDGGEVEAAVAPLVSL